MGYFRPAIEQMSGYTPGFQPRKTDIVKLNTNENPYPPSPKVLEVLRGLPAEALRRYPDPMGAEFAHAAAPVLGVDPANILCTNGGDDLLNIGIRAFCDADRPVAFAQPTYSLYPVLAQLQGCPCLEIPRGTDGSLDALARINAPLTIVCNPNAPTCDLLPVDALADLADRLSGILLIDEAYVDFADQNALPLVGRFDNVIILRSMSKGYSLAGMRFGFGIADGKLVNGLTKVRDSYPVDAVSIAVAAAAMQDQDYHRACVDKVKAQRKRLTEQLPAFGMEVPPSQTNFLLARCVNMQAAAVYEELAKRDIYVRYFPLPGLEDKLRITVGTPEQNDRLLNALKAICA